MSRIVLDTSVVVAALRSRTGASNVLLRQVAYGKHLLLMTPPLFLEYEAVLKRAEQRLVTGLELKEIDQFLSALASACDPVEIHFQWRPQLKDSNDEMVLETAVNGRADVLISYNIKDFKSAAQRFGLRVLRPSEFLQEVIV